MHALSARRYTGCKYIISFITPNSLMEMQKLITQLLNSHLFLESKIQCESYWSKAHQILCLHWENVLVLSFLGIFFSSLVFLKFFKYPKSNFCFSGNGTIGDWIANALPSFKMTPEAGTTR